MLGREDQTGREILTTELDMVERMISHVLDPLPGRETQGRGRQTPKVQRGHQTAPPPGGLLAWSPISGPFVSVLLTLVDL